MTVRWKVKLGAQVKLPKRLNGDALVVEEGANDSWLSAKID